MITEEIQRRTLSLIQEYTGGASAPLEGLLSLLDSEAGPEGQLTRESRKMLFRMASGEEATYDIIYTLAQEMLGALTEAREGLQEILYGGDGVLRWSPAVRNPPPDSSELEELLTRLQSIRRNNLTETVVEGLGARIEAATQALTNFSTSSEPNLVKVITPEALRVLGGKMHYLQFLAGRLTSIESEVRSLGIPAAATATAMSQLETFIEVSEDLIASARDDKGASAEVTAQLVALLSMIQHIQGVGPIFGELVSPDVSADAMKLYSEMQAELWLDPVDGTQELLAPTVLSGEVRNDLPSPVQLVYPGNQIPVSPADQDGDILEELRLELVPGMPSGKAGKVYELPPGWTVDALEGIDVLHLSDAQGTAPITASEGLLRWIGWVPELSESGTSYTRVYFPFGPAGPSVLWLQVRTDPGTTHRLSPEGPDVFSPSWGDYPLELRTPDGSWLFRAELDPSQAPPGPTYIDSDTLLPAPSLGTEVVRILDSRKTDGITTSTGFHPGPELRDADIGDVLVVDSQALPITFSWGEGFELGIPFPVERNLVGGGPSGKVEPGEEDPTVTAGLFSPMKAGDPVYAFPALTAGALPERAEVLGWSGTALLTNITAEGSPPATYEKIVLCSQGGALPSYRVFSSGQGYEVQLDLLSDFFARGSGLHPRILRGVAPVEMKVRVRGQEYPLLQASLGHVYLPGDVLPLGEPATISGTVRGGVKVAELDVPVFLDPLQLGGLPIYGGSVLYDLSSRGTWEIPDISELPSGEVFGSLSKPMRSKQEGPLSYGGPVPFGPFARATYYLNKMSLGYETTVDAVQRASQSLGTSSLGIAGSGDLTYVPGEGFLLSGLVGQLEGLLGCDVVPSVPGVLVRDVKGFPIRVARVFPETNTIQLTGIPRGALAGDTFPVRFSATWVSSAFQSGVKLHQTYLELAELLRTIHPSRERWYAALGRSAEGRGDSTLAQKFREYRVAEILQGASADLPSGAQLSEKLAGLLDGVKGD